MRSATRKQIGTVLESFREEMTEHIMELIAIESETDNKGECDRALDYVLDLGRSMGMRWGVSALHDCGFLEIGQGEEVMGILVHVDVVAPGDMDKWPFSPYEGVITDDGMFHGRGIVDDKGPVIMCLYILKAIMDLNIPLEKRIRLIIGTAEEGITWYDMEHYIEQFGAPDFGFSPDGDFPVYYSEKGYSDVVLTFPEPGRIENVINVESGESRNSIPSKALWETREKGKRTYDGRAFHSSMPQCADNAILKLAADASKEGYDFGRFICDMFTDEHAPGLMLDDGTDTVDGVFVDRTVASPTVLRLTDSGITVNVNVRVRYGISEEEVENSFRKLESKYNYSFESLGFSAPMMVDYRLPFVQKMNEVYESYGYSGDYLVASGASYAAAFPNSICWGPVLPGDLGCAHMEDESLSVESMMTACSIYMEYIIEMCEKN